MWEGESERRGQSPEKMRNVSFPPVVCLCQAKSANKKTIFRK